MTLLRRIAFKVEVVNKVHLLRAIEFMVPIKTRHQIESSAPDVSASNGRLPVIAQLAAAESSGSKPKEYFAQIALAAERSHLWSTVIWTEEGYPVTDFEEQFMSKELPIYRLRLRKRISDPR